MEKRPFFRAATAGLGKYHTGGYGRIGVYRVLIKGCLSGTPINMHVEEPTRKSFYYITLTGRFIIMI